MARLSDCAGQILVLVFFASCAASSAIRREIAEHHSDGKGNPAGGHVGVNLQAGQEPHTQHFSTTAGFDVVLEDFSWTVPSRFGSGGQPIFGIVNCVTNSPSHAPYEVLCVQDGYGQRIFPLGAFRAASDPVRAALVPTTVSTSVASGDGICSLMATAAAGQPARWKAPRTW